MTVAIPYTASEEHWSSMVGIPTANGVQADGCPVT